jgi:hypothetical protein
MSSDSSVLCEAGDSDDSGILEAAAQPARRGPYQLKTNGGPFLCAVVVDPAMTDRLPAHECSEAVPDFPEHRSYLVGLVAMCWQLLLGALPERTSKVFLGISKRIHAATTPFAWVDYLTHSTCEVQPYLLEGNLASKPLMLQSVRRAIQAVAELKAFAGTVAYQVHDIVVISPRLAACLFGGCISPIFSAPVVQRVRGWPFTHAPSFDKVRRHVESVGCPRHSTPSAKLLRVHAPTADVKFLIDPCDLLRFLDVTRLLRSSAFLANAARKTVGLYNFPSPPPHSHYRLI